MKINGEGHYLWRAVVHEGEVLESCFTKTWDKKAALTFLGKAMRKHARAGDLVKDKLRSYGTALKEIGALDRRATGRWLNNREENSHLPFRRRECTILRCLRTRSLQKCIFIHGSIYDLFNSERSLHTRPNFNLSRAAALTE